MPGAVLGVAGFLAGLQFMLAMKRAGRVLAASAVLLIVVDLGCLFFTSFAPLTSLYLDP